MLWSIKTCQIKVSADQYIISWAQVKTYQGQVSYEVLTYQALVSIGLQAQPVSIFLEARRGVLYYFPHYQVCHSRVGGTPLYGLYGYVQPQRVWFFNRFSHKLGIDFSHFDAILVINRVSIFAL